MTSPLPQQCQLSHAGFRMLGEPVFRLSEGARVPSMVVQLENQEAVLPLRSIAREFGIDSASPDGQMLALIEQALDYVVSLRLGDRLPSELLGGEASWEPNSQDRMIAASQVRHNLVRSVFARTGKSVVVKGGAVAGWEADRDNAALLRDAITAAAGLVTGTDGAEITARIDALNHEMAYIACMRRTLIRGISGPRDKLLGIQLVRVPAGRQDTVKQVQLLARRGLAEITARFDAIDVRLDDILAVLRDMQAAVAWLRGQRDWLFRTNHAWGPVFADWATAPGHFDDFLWRIVERTYVFLAPRYMSFTEWAVKDQRVKKDVLRGDTW